jgi:hypothetical protein
MIINNNSASQKDSAQDYDISSWQFSENWTTVSQIEEEVKALKTSNGTALSASTAERPKSVTSNFDNS